MKIWAKTDGAVREGKYLVVRRDGTTPHWAHFVIGGEDPSARAALVAYADDAEARGLDPEYVSSIRELAVDFSLSAENARLKTAMRHVDYPKGPDPDAPPHRTDCRPVIAMMRRETSVAALVAEAARYRKALEQIRDGREVRLPDGTTEIHDRDDASDIAAEALEPRVIRP